MSKFLRDFHFDTWVDAVQEAWLLYTDAYPDFWIMVCFRIWKLPLAVNANSRHMRLVDLKSLSSRFATGRALAYEQGSRG